MSGDNSNGQEKKKTSWISTNYPGIFYRNSRRLNKNKTDSNGNYVYESDKYFVGWFSHKGQRFQITFGSQNKFQWTPKKCADKMAEFRKNAQTGSGPTSFEDERVKNEEARQKEEAELEARKRLNVTFSDFFEETYFPDAQAQKKADTSYREYNLYKRWLKPWIGDKPLPKIEGEDLERIQNDIVYKYGRSPRTAQYALAVARQCLEKARKKKFISENPHRNVEKVKVNNAKKAFLNQEEAERLLQRLKNGSPDKKGRTGSYQLYLMALFSLHTGCRFSEAATLTWDKIRFKGDTFAGGEVVFTDTKNGRSRTVPLSPRLREELENWKSGEDLVFPSRNPGEPMKSVSKAFYDALRDEGLQQKDGENLNFHSLRHSYASWQAQSGLPLTKIQYLLGHQTLAMTSRYSHLQPEHVAEATAVFERQEPKFKVEAKPLFA